MKYWVGSLPPGALNEALALVERVFMEFEAPEYPPEGVAEFLAYIEKGHIAGMLESGQMRLWCCRAGGRLVGVLAACGLHISLLFVDPAYHRQGIARQLLEAMLAAGREFAPGEVTVNASAYGLAAYRRMGFRETGSRQTKNGITFTPMARPRR